VASMCASPPPACSRGASACHRGDIPCHAVRGRQAPYGTIRVRLAEGEKRERHANTAGETGVHAESPSGPRAYSTGLRGASAWASAHGAWGRCLGVGTGARGGAVRSPRRAQSLHGL
jgi:hypothetical protein